MDLFQNWKKLLIPNKVFLMKNWPCKLKKLLKIHPRSNSKYHRNMYRSAIFQSFKVVAIMIYVYQHPLRIKHSNMTLSLYPLEHAINSTAVTYQEHSSLTHPNKYRKHMNSYYLYMKNVSRLWFQDKI